MKIRFGCYLIAALLSSIPARADMIVDVDSLSAKVRSMGNGLDVTLTNTGPMALNLFAFNFTISTSNTGITSRVPGSLPRSPTLSRPTLSLGRRLAPLLPARQWTAPTPQRPEATSYRRSHRLLAGC